MNNKEAMELLEVNNAEELNKIHRVHANDEKGWVKKIKVNNSITGHYKRDEWHFTNEYFNDVLIPQFKANVEVPEKGKKDQGVSVFVMDIQGEFRIGIRQVNIPPEKDENNNLIYLYKDVNSDESFWSKEAGGN